MSTVTTDKDVRFGRKKETDQRSEDIVKTAGGNVEVEKISNIVGELRLNAAVPGLAPFPSSSLSEWHLFFSLLSIELTRSEEIEDGSETLFSRADDEEDDGERVLTGFNFNHVQFISGFLMGLPICYT